MSHLFYKTTFLVLIFMCFITSISGCTFLPPAETKTPGKEGEPNTALDMVLGALLLERQDLGISRPLSPHDPFLLNKVPLFLKSPLQIKSFADECAGSLGREPHSLSSLITFAAHLMEIDIKQVNRKEGQFQCAEGADLPPALRQAVEPIYAAVFNARGVFEEAFKGLTPEESLFVKRNFAGLLFSGSPEKGFTRKQDQDETERAMHLAARIDRKKMLEAACIVLSAIDKALEILRREDFSHAACFIKKETILTNTPLGEVIIGGPGNNHYTGKMPLLLIDVGGDDHYSFLEYNPLSVVIDVSGNDTYESSDSAPLGAGIMGMGFLIDVAGDDQYLGQNFSFGCGFLGVGVLMDEKGNDRYISRTMTQGAGALGLGILCDAEGNDFYQCTLYGQGFGFSGGCGLLIDHKGNDSFIAGGVVSDYREKNNAFQTYSQGFGLGCRNFAAGGIGMLYNGEGDDTYEGSYFCQGSSYWLSMGMLIDANGNDQYRARRYSQGSGIHASIGALIDKEGNDLYQSWAVSQGCGHDRSIGMLWDSRGDDRYEAEWLSQGSGNDSGIGILLDEHGADTYTAGTHGTQGCGMYDERRDEASIGVLVDGGGKDVFSGNGRDKKLWTSGKIGGGVDADGNLPAVWDEPLQKAEGRGQKTEDRGQKAEGGRQIKWNVVAELEAPLFQEDSWEKAAEALANKGASIIPSLLRYLEIKDVGVGRTLEETFKKIGKRRIEDLQHIAVQKDTGLSEKTFLLYVLGDIANPKSKDLFLKTLQDKDSRTQALSLRGLYKLKASPPIKDARQLVKSKNADVRKYLALSLRGCSDGAVIRLLKKLQQDRDFNVRYAAARSAGK